MFPVTDDLSWMKGLRDDEARFQIICNGCNSAMWTSIPVTAMEREVLAIVMKTGGPDLDLVWANVRAKAALQGWLSVPAEDGGTVDFCPACQAS